MSTDSVRSHLKQMEPVGLVRRNAARGHRWTRIHLDKFELADLAAEMGSAGHTANITAYNDRAREVRDKQLEQGRREWAASRPDTETTKEAA